MHMIFICSYFQKIKIISFAYFYTCFFDYFFYFIVYYNFSFLLTFYHFSNVSLSKLRCKIGECTLL